MSKALKNKIKLSSSVSVTDFGAVGDGIVDDSTALQAALNAGGDVRGVAGHTYNIAVPLTVTVAGTTFTGNGCQVRQMTTAIPAFITSVSRVTIASTRITNGVAKPNSNSSGPYLAGIAYHAGILQISGDYLTVEKCTFTDWTAGVSHHGAQDAVTLAKGLKIVGNTFIRYDFGALVRQFNGATFSGNVGYDCEETAGDPAHLLYVTDRGTAQSKTLTVYGNVEENNTSSDSLKIRNVDGFTMVGNTAVQCVRGFSVGFCENGTIAGNTLSRQLLRVGDTAQTGINVDDSRNIAITGNVIEMGIVEGNGIRIRSDLNTFGNAQIFSSGNLIRYDGTLSSRTAYRVDNITDFVSSNDAFTNVGSGTARYAFRLFGCVRPKIIEPVLCSDSAIANSGRVAEIDSACVNAAVYGNESAWPTWVTSSSVLNTGTNTVVKATSEVLASVGSLAAPSISFAGDPDTGFYRSAANVMGAVAGGTLVASFVANRVQFAVNAYPTTDNANDNGIQLNRWRRTYTTEIRPGAGDVVWTSGVGTPEGVVTAVVGSLFTRTDGGASTTLYVKQSGVGNTGWVAK